MKMTLLGVEKVAGRVHRGNKEPRRREKERTSIREKGSVVYRGRRREKINRKEAGMSLGDWLRDATLWRNMCVNGCQGEWLVGLFFAPSTSTFFVGGACGNHQREWRSRIKAQSHPSEYSHARRLSTERTVNRGLRPDWKADSSSRK